MFIMFITVWTYIYCQLYDFTNNLSLKLAFRKCLFCRLNKAFIADVSIYAELLVLSYAIVSYMSRSGGLLDGLFAFSLAGWELHMHPHWVY